MAQALSLAAHLSPEELYRRYRSAHDPTERSHWHIVWLKSQGKATNAIGEVTGYSAYWIREIIHRYNREGAEGLRDHRHDHPGAPTMLSDEQQDELVRLLENDRAPDGGPWTGPKVARWIEQQTGRKRVHDQRGWDYLLRLGFTAQTPRPRHQEADPAQQEAFKKQAGRAYARAPQ